MSSSTEDYLEPFARREFEKLRKARHRAVFVHYLADYARRVEPREARYIDRRFGVSRALEHAARGAP